MRKTIARVAVALSVLLGTLVGFVGDAKPAGAVILQNYDYYMDGPGTAHSYHIHMEMHSNAVWYMKVGRYSRGFGQLLGIEVETQTYAFPCFSPVYGNSNTPIRIYVDAMGDYPGGGGPHPCNNNNVWTCQNVYGDRLVPNGVQVSWDYKYYGFFDHQRCPFDFGTGNIAFGYYAPFFRNSYTQWFELW